MAIGIVSITNINKTSVQIYDQNIVPLSPLNNIEIDMYQLELKQKDIAINADNDDIIAISNLQSDMLNQLGSYSKYVSSSKEQSMLKKMVDDMSSLTTTEKDMENDFLLNQKSQGLKLMYGSIAKYTSDFDKTIKNMFQLKTDQAKTRNEANKRQFYSILTLLIAVCALAIAVAVFFSIFVSRIFSRPLRQLVKDANAIADGTLDVEIDIARKDEIGMLAAAFARIAGSLRSLRGDVHSLISGAIEGRLDVRADADAHQGAYGEIISGVNHLLDAIVEPLNTASACIERLSRGDMSETITEDFHGDFNELKTNLNSCIETIRGLVRDANMLSNAAMAGKLSTRADANAHQGDFRRIIEGVNGTLDAITGPLYTAADYIDRISRGELPDEITEEYKGEFDLLRKNLNICIESIRNLTADADRLSEAAVAGRLSERADENRHQGEYRKIISGVNHTLDAITVPLYTAASYIDRISRGDIPEKIEENYQGDFNLIKNNINVCIDAINSLITDANLLSQAAEEGRLSFRADESRHQGDFRRIIEGVNHTLDAFIAPIQESAAVLNEMAKGNLNVSVKGDYKGDLAQIKKALNETIVSLSGYITDISDILSEISAGNLNVEISSEYKGDFAQIKLSLNNIVRSLSSTLEEIRIAADEVASGSSQVSAGSQQLSEGTAEQANAIEQLTLSVNEIAKQAKSNAENAARAREITDSMQTNAAGGDQQMKQMLTSIDEIEKSSSDISKIIKVIDDIAFQTNILALNAAVEAARAGQYGKGFAVVAEEVRNLAAKSGDAAKETTDLIENTIRKSKAGQQMANVTAETLHKIIEDVGKAADLMGAISDASDNQATEVLQVSRGIDQISKVVQTNSATAEESAASSEELSGQSEQLNDKIGHFRLKAVTQE